MTYLPGGRINATIGGNTAGAGALISSGTLTLAGGNNVTLSQNGNAITISGGAAGGGSNTLGISNLGNTAGTSGVVSGSAVRYLLAGGNNVTLSQSINGVSGTVTISAANQTVQTQSNIQAFYDGAASISTGTVRLSNANGIGFGINGQTLTMSHNGITSQTNQTVGLYALGNTTQNSSTTLDARTLSFNGLGAATVGYSNGSIQISAPVQTVQTQQVHNLTLSGNTAGVMAQVSSGTLTLAGGDNITLSQNGNAVTISGGAGGAAGSNTFGISNLGNTAGTSGVLSGSAVRYLFAGGNNVTLSQSINGSSATVTVSAANQTVQTQNVHNVSLSGNTAGVMAHVSSGTLTLAGGNNITLSQNGNAVSIIGGAGGGGGIALANSQTTYATGTANLVASGALTIASTAGQSFNFSVPQTSSLVGVNGITVTSNGSTVSISGGGGGPKTLSFYQNMDRGTSASLATANGTLMLQRLNQENDLFAGYLTANTILLNLTANMTATSLSSSHSVSVSLAIYSDNDTALSLINSVSTSWAIGANVGNTASYHGPRWLSFVSSQWSSTPVFVDGGEYVFGVVFRSANYGPPISYIGQNYMMSNQRSGYIGTSIATNTSLAQGNYWNAMYSATTAAFPTGITSNQVNRNNATAIFMPHVILNNRYAGTF